MLYAIVIALLVAADQLVKYLVRTGIPLGGSVPFLPHLVELTYVQNTGAAFSLLEKHTWVLTLVSVLVSIGLILVLVKKVIRHPFGRWPVAVILAGAIGNLIDRAAFQYVTDMFNLLFMRFAVFNVADICVVLGGIAICLYAIFGWDKYERKEPPHDQDHPAG